VTLGTILFTFIPLTLKNCVSLNSTATRLASKALGVKFGFGVITSVTIFLVKGETGGDGGGGGGGGGGGVGSSCSLIVSSFLFA
jgi:hypothetical protein